MVFLFVFLLWIGAVYFFYEMASGEGKDPTLVLVLGVLFGPIGSVIGYALAKVDDAERAAPKPTEESEVERLRRQLAEAEARQGRPKVKAAPKKKAKKDEPDVYEL